MTSFPSAAITFIYTADLVAAHNFYGQALGLPLTTDQGVCRIYRISQDGFLGVCAHRPPSPDGVIVTLVVDDPGAWHQRLTTAGLAPESPPSHNPRFGITHFFIRDPDGYLVEIQSFDDPDWQQPI